MPVVNEWPPRFQDVPELLDERVQASRAHLPHKLIFQLRTGSGQEGQIFSETIHL
jgi:hypothetical protein